jgi:hypothetical protein
MCSVMFAILSKVTAQSFSRFAPDEGQRLYGMLNGLACIGNELCELGDFTPTAACDHNTDYVKCDASGHLAHLYVLCCNPPL